MSDNSEQGRAGEPTPAPAPLVMTVTGGDAARRAAYLRHLIRQWAPSPVTRFVALGRLDELSPVAQRLNALVDHRSERAAAVRLLGQVQAQMFRRTPAESGFTATADTPYLVVLIDEVDDLFGASTPYNLITNLAGLGPARGIGVVVSAPAPTALPQALNEQVSPGSRVDVSDRPAPGVDESAASLAGVEFAQPVRGITIGHIR